jgi:signal transduction histidine kinase/FixJ family two-component response regulator
MKNWTLPASAGGGSQSSVPEEEDLEEQRCSHAPLPTAKPTPEFVGTSPAIRHSYRNVSFILLLGLSASAAFLGLGMFALNTVENDDLDRFSTDLYYKIDSALDDYKFAASMIHNRCRGRNFTRREFRQVYEYLVAGSLDVQAVDFKPQVTHAERSAYEAEARDYYAKYYPYIPYQGFRGFNFANSTSIELRLPADVYFPVHYLEPVMGNEKAIDLDFYASGSRRHAIEVCLQSGKPTISDRLKLVQERLDVAYGVVLLHPGVNLTQPSDIWPRDLASIVIRIPDLLKRATLPQSVGVKVYLHDRMESNDESIFLGAVQVGPFSKFEQESFLLLPEISLAELSGVKRVWMRNLNATDKVWTVSVVPLDGSFEPQLVFVILGGVFILLASVFLAWGVHRNTQRVVQFSSMKHQVEAEKAALILEHANNTAKSERELNDFISHEVRNPVAAAMVACSFMERITSKNPTTIDLESWEILKGDVSVVSNALHFINDLLRNMLDMHRATSQQLVVNMAPLDVLHDVLEPVHSMLYVQGGAVAVSVLCPPGLFVTADKLRLKQVILNLGRNSSKFVDNGFIRLCATKLDNNLIEFAVEDSGPGIPTEKREKIFNKYQDSLDELAQGTGIGLFLCRKLVALMGGSICLDESYDSGIPGCPGARITFCLNAPEVTASSTTDEFSGFETEPIVQSSRPTGMSVHHAHEETPSIHLSENLSVLFVDDDAILRKLFTRVIKTVAPTWKIREASNGETALRLTDTDTFDIIFMDMYMASVEKQLLGTDSVAALRVKGVTSCICGLSANDKEKEFMEAGADAFLFKPFPCEERALKRELIRILRLKEDADSEVANASETIE